MIAFLASIFKTKNTDKSERTQRIIIAVMMAVMFIVILVFSVCTPYYDDDYVYSCCHSLSDVLRTTGIYYLNWSGRLISLFLIFLDLFIPKWLFNIANAAVYVWLLYLIYAHAAAGRRDNAAVFIFTAAAAWAFFPAFGQTVLWVSGAATYLWLLPIIMAFLLCYRRDSVGDTVLPRVKSAAVKACLLFLFGLAAGWCSETASGGCVVGCALFILCGLIDKKKIKPWQWSGLAGSLSGLLLLVLSPGNKVRLAMFADDGLSFSVRMISRFANITAGFKELFLVIFIIYLAFYVTGIFAGKGRSFVLTGLLYGLVAVATLYALVLSPYAPPRGYFGAGVFFVAAAAYCVSGVCDDKRTAAAALAVTGALAAYAVILFLQAAPDILLTKIEVNRREEIIQTQIDNGNVNILVPQLRSSSTDYNAKAVSTQDIADIRGSNQAVPNVYTDIETILSVNKEVWSMIYTAADYDLTDCIYYDSYMRAAADEDYVFIIFTQGDIGEINAGKFAETALIGGTLTADDIAGSTFIGIYRGGEALYESVGDGTLTADVAAAAGLNGVAMTVTADSDNAAVCSLRLGAAEYTRRDAGICVFAYDTISGKIVDRAVFIAGDGSAYK